MIATLFLLTELTTIKLTLHGCMVPCTWWCILSVCGVDVSVRCVFVNTPRQTMCIYWGCVCKTPRRTMLCIYYSTMSMMLSVCPSITVPVCPCSKSLGITHQISRLGVCYCTQKSSGSQICNTEHKPTATHKHTHTQTHGADKTATHTTNKDPAQYTTIKHYFRCVAIDGSTGRRVSRYDFSSAKASIL